MLQFRLCERRVLWMFSRVSSPSSGPPTRSRCGDRAALLQLQQARLNISIFAARRTGKDGGFEEGVKRVSCGWRMQRSRGIDAVAVSFLGSISSIRTRMSLIGLSRPCVRDEIAVRNVAGGQECHHALEMAVPQFASCKGPTVCAAGVEIGVVVRGVRRVRAHEEASICCAAIQSANLSIPRIQGVEQNQAAHAGLDAAAFEDRQGRCKAAAVSDDHDRHPGECGCSALIAVHVGRA